MYFQILDESARPLSDVLLSLSGGKQYRSNNITKEDGTMVFTHLVCTVNIVMSNSLL